MRRMNNGQRCLVLLMLLHGMLHGCASEPIERYVGAGTACGGTVTEIADRPDDDLPRMAEPIPERIDTTSCVEGRWAVGLPLGSAWMEVRRIGDCCEVWFGGETEDPSYRGAATQYCRFSRRTGEQVPISTWHPVGGPAVACVPTPACTGAPRANSQYSCDQRLPVP